MKAVVFEEHGGIDKLQLRDIPEPVVSPNEVLIRVRASACNFNDIWARRGLPGMKVILPHVSGSDASGQIAALGSEVASEANTGGFSNLDLHVGDEVVVHCGISCRVCDACTNGQEYFCKQFKIWGFQTGPYDGGHAEYIKIPAVNVIPKPKNLTWEESASMPLVLVTVWRMLVTRARIRPGDFVLVLGAAGGLGVMAVQICRLYGAHAIAVGANEEKLQLARSLGAEYFINRRTQNIAEEVKKITNGRGCDIVFEHVGEATWQQSIMSLKWGGTLVTCGATTGFIGPTDIRFLWNKQMNFLGSHLGSKAELMDAMRFVESGDIKPVVSQVLPLGEIGRAQEIMENSDVTGKIVLVP